MLHLILRKQLLDRRGVGDEDCVHTFLRSLLHHIARDRSIFIAADGSIKACRHAAVAPLDRDVTGTRRRQEA